MKSGAFEALVSAIGYLPSCDGHRLVDFRPETGTLDYQAVCRCGVAVTYSYADAMRLEGAGLTRIVEWVKEQALRWEDHPGLREAVAARDAEVERSRDLDLIRKVTGQVADLLGQRDTLRRLNDYGGRTDVALALIDAELDTLRDQLAAI